MYRLNTVRAVSALFLPCIRFVMICSMIACMAVGAKADVVISVAPTSPTVALGGSVTLTATATGINCEGTGTESTTYEWSVDGSIINGATGSTYTYTAPSTAGTHSVSCKATIKGPNADCGNNSASATVSVIGGGVTLSAQVIRYYGDGSASSLTASAASSQPSGTTYQWTASGPITIVGSSSQSTVTVKGTAGSQTQNDATLTVSYSKGGVSAGGSKSITVRTPSSVHKVLDDTTHINVCYPNGLNHTYSQGFYNQRVTWVLVDQFGAGIDVSTVSEAADTVVQDPGNHTVYPTSDGKWQVTFADHWSTGSDGTFDHPDPYVTSRNGRTSTADPYPVTNLLPEWQFTSGNKAVGHCYHNFIAMGKNVAPFQPNLYYSDHVDIP